MSASFLPTDGSIVRPPPGFHDDWGAPKSGAVVKQNKSRDKRKREDGGYEGLFKEVPLEDLNRWSDWQPFVIEDADRDIVRRLMSNPTVMSCLNQICDRVLGGSILFWSKVPIFADEDRQQLFVRQIDGAWKHLFIRPVLVHLILWDRVHAIWTRDSITGAAPRLIDPMNVPMERRSNRLGDTQWRVMRENWNDDVIGNDGDRKSASYSDAHYCPGFTYRPPDKVYTYTFVPEDPLTGHPRSVMMKLVDQHDYWRRMRDLFESFQTKRLYAPTYLSTEGKGLRSSKDAAAHGAEEAEGHAGPCRDDRLQGPSEVLAPLRRNGASSGAAAAANGALLPHGVGGMAIGYGGPDGRPRFSMSDVGAAQLRDDWVHYRNREGGASIAEFEARMRAAMVSAAGYERKLRPGQRVEGGPAFPDFPAEWMTQIENQTREQIAAALQVPLMLVSHASLTRTHKTSSAGGDDPALAAFNTHTLSLAGRLSWILQELYYEMFEVHIAAMISSGQLPEKSSAKDSASALSGAAPVTEQHTKDTESPKGEREHKAMAATTEEDAPMPDAAAPAAAAAAAAAEPMDNKNDDADDIDAMAEAVVKDVTAASSAAAAAASDDDDEQSSDDTNSVIAEEVHEAAASAAAAAGAASSDSDSDGESRSKRHKGGEAEDDPDGKMTAKRAELQARAQAEFTFPNVVQMPIIDQLAQTGHLAPGAYKRYVCAKYGLAPWEVLDEPARPMGADVAMEMESDSLRANTEAKKTGEIAAYKKAHVPLPGSKSGGAKGKK